MMKVNLVPKLITTSFVSSMRLLYILISIQFAMSNGDLTCFFNTYPKCKVRRINHEFCPYVPSAIKCMEEKALECDVEDSRVVIDMKRIFQDTCQEGTELYKAYLKHETCVFKQASDAAAPCSEDLMVEIQNYNLTGKGDDLGRFKLSCRFSTQVFHCLSEKVAEICGKEAEGYHDEFYGPTMDLINTVCMDNGAASFDYVWTLVLQTSTFLFAHKLFKLTI